jgi:DNA-binding NarL/FixJ family response regulator
MMTATTPIAVGLLDDHHLVREGIRSLLEQQADVTVIGEASDLKGAFALLEQPSLQVMIIDVTIGTEDALASLGALRARRPDVKFLVLTMHNEAETVRQALAQGASGYILKGAYSSELVTAARAVAAGERYLHSSITTRVVEDYLRTDEDVLTSREREVLALIASGRSAAAVGETLGISSHTVRRHLANLRTKLGLRGRGAILRYAISHDLIRAPFSGNN